ncbi:MAG: hypothetical protein OXK82_08200 [Deltaproteobacteria bacterium]|nr:hypothetical protein [Deltaproteobacteria bacterium]
MVELARVKMHPLQNILSTRKDDRNIQSACKSRFVVYSTTGTVIPLREIGNDKAGFPDFSNDLVIYLVDACLCSGVDDSGAFA